MTTRPILFSAPMVRALLDGRKTMTRRLAGGRIRPGDLLWVRETWTLHERFSDLGVVVYAASIDGPWSEAHQQVPAKLCTGTVPQPFQKGWRPSIHMPRWASRITLEVTATRIERLQDISEGDAMAEGIQLKVNQDGLALVDVGSKHSPLHYIDPKLRGMGDAAIEAAWTFRCHFAALWDDLHGPDSWAANPDVAVIGFKVHRTNIDVMAL